MLESCGKPDIASKTYLKRKVFFYERYRTLNAPPNTANGRCTLHDWGDGPFGLC